MYSGYKRLKFLWLEVYKQTDPISYQEKKMSWVLMNNCRRLWVVGYEYLFIVYGV